MHGLSDLCRDALERRPLPLTPPSTLDALLEYCSTLDEYRETSLAAVKEAFRRERREIEEEREKVAGERRRLREEQTKTASLSRELEHTERELQREKEEVKEERETVLQREGKYESRHGQQLFVLLCRSLSSALIAIVLGFSFITSILLYSVLFLCLEKLEGLTISQRAMIEEELEKVSRREKETELTLKLLREVKQTRAICTTLS